MPAEPEETANLPEPESDSPSLEPEIEAPAPEPKKKPRRRFRSAPAVTGGRHTIPNLAHLKEFQWPSALANISFRKYWLSQIVALGGSWMVQTPGQRPHQSTAEGIKP